MKTSTCRGIVFLALLGLLCTAIAAAQQPSTPPGPEGQDAERHYFFVLLKRPANVALLYSLFGTSLSVVK